MKGKKKPPWKDLDGAMPIKKLFGAVRNLKSGLKQEK